MFWPPSSADIEAEEVSELSQLLAGANASYKIDAQAMSDWARHCICDRPSFLNFLKTSVGLQPLQARQKVANWLGKRGGAAAARGQLIAPSPSCLQNGWLVVTAESGLCNKLRVVLSYSLVARVLQRRLLVLWSIGEICEAAFDECFEPLPGVSFVCYKSRIEGGDGAELDGALTRLRDELLTAEDTTMTEDEGPPNSSQVLPCISHQAWDTHHAYKGTDIEWRMFEQLKPRKELREAIAQRIQDCGPCFAALHVRRTDFQALFGETTASTDADFDAFVQAQLDRKLDGGGPPTRIFLATDDESYQRRLASQLGDRLCALTSIDPASRRPTPVATAVIDLFVAAAAPCGFKGTRWSSFSDPIHLLRRGSGLARPDTDDHIVDSFGIPNADRSKGAYLHDLAPPGRRHLGVFFS